jgi:hypothetical protein
MKRTFIMLLLVVLASTMTGCVVQGPPNPGFIVVTQERGYISGVIPYDRPIAGIDTEGDLRFADDDASGSVRNFRQNSGSSGQITVRDGRAPGTWFIKEWDGPCAFESIYAHMKRADYNYITCVEGAFPFQFSPFAFNADAPPSTFQVLGASISGTYGKPTIQFRTYTGTLVAKVRATEVDQGRAIANTTALRSLPSGSYSAQVWNVTSNGSAKLVGTAPMRVYRPEPPPDPCAVQHIQTDEGQVIELKPPICN